MQKNKNDFFDIHQKLEKIYQIIIKDYYHLKGEEDLENKFKGLDQLEIKLDKLKYKLNDFSIEDKLEEIKKEQNQLINLLRNKNKPKEYVYIRDKIIKNIEETEKTIIRTI